MSMKSGTPAGKPMIVISDVDHRRLSDLAAGAFTLFPDIAEALQSEMDRAEVVAAEAVPSDAVRMGSIVEFRSDAGRCRRVTLVFPPEADIAANRVSILTPIGTALIGLSAGQSIRFATYDGRQHVLTVLRVEQPDRAGASGRRAIAQGAAQA